MRPNPSAASFPCKIEAALQAVNLPDAATISSPHAPQPPRREQLRVTPRKRPHHPDSAPLQHVQVIKSHATRQTIKTQPSVQTPQRSALPIHSTFNSANRPKREAASTNNVPSARHTTSVSNSVRPTTRPRPPQPPTNSTRIAQPPIPTASSSGAAPVERHLSVPALPFSNSASTARRVHFYSPSSKSTSATSRQPPYTPRKNSVLTTRLSPSKPPSSNYVPIARRSTSIPRSSTSVPVTRLASHSRSSPSAHEPRRTNWRPHSYSSAPTARRAKSPHSASNPSPITRRSTSNPSNSSSRPSGPVTRRPEAILSSSLSTPISRRRSNRNHPYSRNTRASLRAPRSTSLRSQANARPAPIIPRSALQCSSSSHHVANQSPVRPQQATLLDFSSVLEAPLQKKYATAGGQRQNKKRRIDNNSVRFAHNLERHSAI